MRTEEYINEKWHIKKIWRIKKVLISKEFVGDEGFEPPTPSV
jgi:hypothetical protein